MAIETRTNADEFSVYASTCYLHESRDREGGCATAKRKHSKQQQKEVGRRVQCEMLVCYKMVHMFDPSLFFLAGLAGEPLDAAGPALFFFAEPRSEKRSLCLNLGLAGDCGAAGWLCCSPTSSGGWPSSAGGSATADLLDFVDFVDFVDLFDLIDLIDFLDEDLASDWGALRVSMDGSFIGVTDWRLFASSSSQLARYMSIRYVPITALLPPLSRCSMSRDSETPSSSSRATTFASMGVLCVQRNALMSPIL